jgi:hypothetical protein
VLAIVGLVDDIDSSLSLTKSSKTLKLVGGGVWLLEVEWFFHVHQIGVVSEQLDATLLEDLVELATPDFLAELL